MDDIYTYLIPLPDGINEVVLPCLGGYTVYIDSRLSQEKQLRSYQHALGHIINHDFEKSDVQEIEKEAHERTHIRQNPPDQGGF